MLELTQKRTLHSKTHDLGEGKMRLTASMIPMHYEDNGQLLDIDMTIQNGVVNSGLYKVELMTDKIGFHAIDRGSGKKISVSLGKIGNQSVAYASPVLDGNKATWPSIKPNVDVEFIFNPHQVNIFRVLQNASAEKFAEWEIEEELGDKTIKMNDVVRGRDNAKNETKHTVVIAPPSTANNRKSYVIRDTFEDRVFKRNPQTRVKEESADVAYPVRIDPTVTVNIVSGADDGRAARYITGAVTTSDFFDPSGTDNVVVNFSDGAGTARIDKSFFRFTGITIPQSSTINSATLKPYVLGLNNSGPNQITVQAREVNDPAAPTNFAQAFSPATLAAAAPTFNGTFGTGAIISINVATLVQELVNSFDYSNEAMLFFIKTPQFVTAFGNRKQVEFECFEHADANEAQLVIDYTAGGGGSDIKTFNGVTNANTKLVNGVTNANVKSKNGVSNV